VACRPDRSEAMNRPSCLTALCCLPGLLCSSAVLAQSGAASAPGSGISAPSGGHYATLLVQESCAPAVPSLAEHVGGTFVSHLLFTIDAEGKVIDAKIESPSGSTPVHRALDRTARDGLSLCPAVPGADADGHPATTTISVQYTWKLHR
jgi:TonB family protein